MKKIALVLILCVVTLCGCSTIKDNSTPMEKIQKRLSEMESYTCDATMKRISNKGENTYDIKQYYKSSGEYRLEIVAPENLKGNYTVFDGEKICQYNSRIDGKIIVDVPESQQRNELFLGSFIKNYMKSEDVSVAVDKMEGGKTTVLEAVIPGDNKYLATEKLWVSNDTLDPVQLIIYDKDGKERFIVNYNKFEYNVEIGADMFKVLQ